MARELTHECDCGYLLRIVLKDNAVGKIWRCPSCGKMNATWKSKEIPVSPCDHCNWDCSQCKLTKRQTS